MLATGTMPGLGGEIMTKTQTMVCALLCLLPALAACHGSAAKQPKRKGKAIAIRFVPAKSTEGFLKHWTLGSKSAWYSMERHEVLIADSSDQSIVKLTGLPREHGHIVATGWEGGKRFFIHFSHGADEGTMVYIDLDSREITETKHWAAP